ncbi:hypothetical protein PTKIN_Ptkin12aG0129400 [Pterospermum kingtungense]
MLVADSAGFRFRPLRKFWNFWAVWGSVMEAWCRMKAGHLPQPPQAIISVTTSKIVKMLKLEEQQSLGEASCALSEIVTKPNRPLTLDLVCRYESVSSAHS